MPKNKTHSGASKRPEGDWHRQGLLRQKTGTRHKTGEEVQAKLIATPGRHRRGRQRATPKRAKRLLGM